MPAQPFASRHRKDSTPSLPPNKPTPRCSGEVELLTMFEDAQAVHRDGNGSRYARQGQARLWVLTLGDWVGSPRLFPHFLPSDSRDSDVYSFVTRLEPFSLVLNGGFEASTRYVHSNFCPFSLFNECTTRPSYGTLPSTRSSAVPSVTPSLSAFRPHHRHPKTILFTVKKPPQNPLLGLSCTPSPAQTIFRRQRIPKPSCHFSLLMLQVCRTKLHSALTFAALVLLQRLKASFPSAHGSSCCAARLVSPNVQVSLHQAYLYVLLLSCTYIVLLVYI